MMKIMNWVVAVAFASALTACGGGGGSSGTSPLVPTPPSTTASSPAVTAASVEVLTSDVQIQSGGGQATITAVVKGSGNVSLPAIPVTFSTDSGTLTSVSPVTDTSGTATAKLSAGADKTNRTMTIKVVAGAVNGSVQVAVAGTKLSLSGVATLILGDAKPYVILLADNNGLAIPNATVTVSSKLGNGLSATSIKTDGTGSATVTYTATNSGTDQLTFTGVGATAAQTIQVSGENFAFVSPTVGTQVQVGSLQPVTVQFLRAGAPQAGIAVAFSSTAGTVSPASAVTDATGRASTVVSSQTANPATVSARLTGGTAEAALALQFIAFDPAKLVLQVNPTAVSPNPAGSTAQQVDVVATLTDAVGNPVSNKIISFSRTQDPSGGNLSQPSAVTDSNGTATVKYIAGAGATANKGVLLHAVVADKQSVTGDATLTVNQSALFIALGTSNEISNADPQTYKKDWVVYVTDANGVAVPNMKLTMSVLPVTYRKGYLLWNGKIWDYPVGRSPSFTECPTEDANRNGVLDPGEDQNGNRRLEPGNVVSVSPGVVTTDQTGRATVSLLYAESYSPWVVVTLNAQAVVSGTESNKSQTFLVPYLSGDFTVETVAPAGSVSPFGLGLTCTDPN